jgi:sugar phosphate isomerase/epimerase
MTTWMPYIDFGVVHALAFPECRTGEGPIIETLQAIVGDACFGAVEIAPIKDPAVRRQARDLLHAASLQVVYLPILPILLEDLGLGSPDADLRRAAHTRLRVLIDEAIGFDAPLAMIMAPADPGGPQREATTARLVEDLRELCDYADAQAKRRRLHLTLENFDREIEKKRLIGPTVEAAALAIAIERENFGLTIDLSHLPLLRETPAEALRAAGPHLIHAHIGNCVIDYPQSSLYGDFHPRFGHPEGCNDVPQVVEFLHELHAVGYWGQARHRLNTTPILSIEVRPTDGDTSETILANGKRTFIRAWEIVSSQLSVVSSQQSSVIS